MSDKSKKWVVKDSSGRVRGPYATKDILTLIGRGVFSGGEEIARYPGGTWQSISQNIEFYDRLLEVLAEEADVKEYKTRQSQDAELDALDDEYENRNSQAGSTGRSRQSATGTPSATEEMRGRAVKESTENLNYQTPKFSGPSSNGFDSTSGSKNTGFNDEAEDFVESLDDKAGKKSKKKSPTSSSEDVIDLSNKDDILKSEKKRGLRLPGMLLLLIIFSAGVLLILDDPKKPKSVSKIYLRAPQKKGAKPLSGAKVNDLYRKAMASYSLDTFSGYFKAQNFLVKAIEGSRRNKEALSLLCLTYREIWPYTARSNNDLKTFTSVAKEANKIDPSGKDGMICSISLALARGEYKRAETLVESALPANVREPVFYEIRAKLWGDKRRFNLAIDYLRTIHNLSPQWVKPYRLRGQFLSSLGKVAESRQAFQLALNLNPKHSIAKIEIGVLTHRYYSKPDEALRFLSEGFGGKDPIPPITKVEGLKALAEIYLKRSENEQAAKYYKEAYALNPRDQEIQKRLKALGEKVEIKSASRAQSNELIALGEQYERQGDCFAAQAEYRAVYESNPTNAIAAYKAAKCLWRLSQATEALEWLDKAIKADPKYIDAYVTKAKYFSARYDFQAAATVLKRAVKIAPRSYLVYQGWANMKLAQNDFDNAIAYAEKALRLYETDIDSFSIMVKAYLGKQNWNKAYEKASQLQALDKSNPEAQSIYVEALAGLGLEQGLIKARELIDQYQYTIEYRELYGKLLMRDERYADAEMVFKQILQIDEKNKNVMIKLGEVLQAQRRVDEAKDYYLEAAALDPSDVKALFFLGKLYLEAGKPQIALVQFDRVIKANALYPNAHYFAGKAAMASSDLKRALAEAKKEARINPRRAEPYMLMAEIFYEQRLYSACVESYQKTIRLRQPSAYIYVQQARCTRLLGNVDTAQTLLKQAERLESGNPLVWKELGAVCETKQDVSCAIEAYNHYFNLAPNAPDRKAIESRILALQGS